MNQNTQNKTNNAKNEHKQNGRNTYHDNHKNNDARQDKKEAHNQNHYDNHRKEHGEHVNRTYKYLAFVSFSESKKVYSFGCNDNNYHAKKAMEICNECIAKLGLDMNLIEAEYTLDCSKIIFVYVADERVDFRELLKDLASIFKCRIELRQIGPRNKSKIIGGLGMCGMETCCSRFLNDFDVVSINMAKNQLLALNIQKLSGQCGKLMCCLKYEDGQYKKLREGLPKMNSQIEYKGSRYRITSMNVLLQQVKIENKEDVQFLSFQELWPDIDFSDR